jgi:hypothetical protein
MATVAWIGESDEVGVTFAHTGHRTFFGVATRGEDFHSDPDAALPAGASR